MRFLFTRPSRGRPPEPARVWLPRARHPRQHTVYSGHYGFCVIVKVDVMFLMFWKLLLILRLLKVTEPTVGPWPGSGKSLAHKPKPDLASNASPLRCAPVIVMLVNTVSATGNCGCPPT